MLAKRRCPHTGIVNFYCDPEPFLAVGSIARACGSGAYAWRSYLGVEAGGLSTDMASAEADLARVILAAIKTPAVALPQPPRGRQDWPGSLKYIGQASS